MIETDRLLIRNFQMKDKDDCFAFLGDEATCLDDGGFHAFTSQDKEYMLLMKRFEEQKERYVIVCKETMHVIGIINMMPGDRAVLAYEIGYVISPICRRQGYAFEAIQGVMNHYHENYHVSLFTASCFSDNAASENLLRKLRFNYEGFKYKALNHAVLGPTTLKCYYKEIID